MLSLPLVSACEPRDTYELTNATSQDVTVDGREIAPGDSGEIELGTRCQDTVVRTTDLRHAARLETCAHESYVLVPEDLEPAPWASVVNGTDRALEVWFAGGVPVDGAELPPDAELTVGLVTDLGSCEADPDGQALLWAVPEDDGSADAATAYHWDAVCDGERWVIDAGALSIGSATATVVNETDVTMTVRVWIGEQPTPGDGEYAARDELSPGDALDVPLRVRMDACVAGGIDGRSVGSDELITLDEELELCDGRHALTRALLRHSVDGRWVPLDLPHLG